MPGVFTDNMAFLIPLLFLVSFAGFTYAIIRALQAGAESYATVYTQDAARQFADIFLFIPPKRILELAWTAAGASFLIFFFLVGHFDAPAGIAQGAIVGGVAAAVALRSPGLVLKLLRQRRLQRFNDQLVDALMTMGNSLKSGGSIMQAIEHVVRQNLSPISQEFAFFLQQVRVGVKFEEALQKLEHSVQSEDLTLVACAIETARQTGGSLTDVFDRIAATIRERHRIQGRVKALTAQGRMQGVVVGLMPFGLAMLMFVVDPTLMSSFFTSAMGIAMGAGVVVLDVLGAIMIRKIVRIDI